MHAFKVLDTVPKSAGWIKYTSKWNVVHVPAKARVYYRTKRNKGIKSIDLKKFDLSCQNPVKMYDMQTDKKGPINEFFVEFDKKKNRAMIAKNTFLSEELVDLAANYPELYTSCMP